VGVDGGTRLSRGVNYDVYAVPNDDGTYNIESAQSPRAVLAFYGLVQKIAQKMAKAASGELRDIVGQPVTAYSPKCERHLICPPVTSIRIGSVVKYQDGNLRIRLVKTGPGELPPIPRDADVETFTMDHAGIIGWLTANATAITAKADRPAAASNDSTAQDDFIGDMR
jgi:hypothetical protein